MLMINLNFRDLVLS